MVDGVESTYNLYTKHVYTECTAEAWADQQVSDGGPCSLYIQYKCTELENDESDYNDKVVKVEKKVLVPGELKCTIVI